MAKTKKMTQKEFKEALKAGNMDFEIWEWEGILNVLSIFNAMQADKEESDGMTAIAEASRDRADTFYQILKNRGYYNQ